MSQQQQFNQRERAQSQQITYDKIPNTERNYSQNQPIYDVNQFQPQFSARDTMNNQSQVQRGMFQQNPQNQQNQYPPNQQPYYIQQNNPYIQQHPNQQLVHPQQQQ